MTIRIRDFPEPLTLASSDLASDTLLIDSEASRLLTREIRRYCRGETPGRSILISGHRGAGKTTLVLDAVERVRKESLRRNLRVRPLLVPVNGPNLFFDPATESDGAAVASPPGEGDAPEAGDRDTALKQIVLALHRAVALEMARFHRERVREDPALADTRRPRLLELSAQLELELFECPVPARLRQFWELAGFLESGVLFRSPNAAPAAAGPDDALRTRPRPDQGMRELLALAGVCEAYCRVSGTLSEREARSGAAKDEQSVSVSGEGGAQQLFAPLAALLTGGLAGVGVHATGAGGVASTLAGIAAALGALSVFKYSASRSTSRSISREASFLRDLTVKTLDRFIPILVERLLQAGLAPVFVIDELDKVDNLNPRMFTLLRQMKKLFAETSFFCFITDRGYYEELQRDIAGHPYPRESTYFTHHLFIVFHHADLHEYLRRLLVVETAAADTPPGAPPGAAA